MTINNYTAVCETDSKVKTEYVFPSISFHDCRVQALQHGLFGDKFLRIELELIDGKGRVHLEREQA